MNNQSRCEIAERTTVIMAGLIVVAFQENFREIDFTKNRALFSHDIPAHCGGGTAATHFFLGSNHIGIVTSICQKSFLEAGPSSPLPPSFGTGAFR